MSEFTLFQEALNKHKIETDKRYEKMETHVEKMVDKMHEGALALTTIATELKSVPYIQHLEDHNYIKDEREASRERTEFYRALKLSLASKFGWKLLVILALLAIALFYHHPEFKVWILKDFLKTEISKEVE